MRSKEGRGRDGREENNQKKSHASNVIGPMRACGPNIKHSAVSCLSILTREKIQIDAHLRRSSLLLQSHLCAPITSGRKIGNRNKKEKCKDDRTQKLKRPWLVMQWRGKKGGNREQRSENS